MKTDLELFQKVLLRQRKERVACIHSKGWNLFVSRENPSMSGKETKGSGEESRTSDANKEKSGRIRLWNRMELGHQPRLELT